MTHNFTRTLLSHGIDHAVIMDFYKKLAALVDPEFIEGIYLQVYVIIESLGYNSETLMMALAQPCDTMLKECFWMGRRINCGDVFRLIEAPGGMCCSFNFRAYSEVLEKIFGNENVSNVPIYVMGAGKSVGLTVLLDVGQEGYLSVSRDYYGIEIVVHDPQEMPPTTVSAVVQPGQDLSLSVSPSVVVSVPDIRDLPISQRMCYFEDERKLRTSDKYSFETCLSECKVDTVLNICNCIPFIYPDTRKLK